MLRSTYKYAKSKRAWMACLCFAAAALFAQPSHALFMGFSIIPGTQNSSPTIIPDIEDQLLVQLVENAGDDTVTFTFFNLIDPVDGVPASITDIYFSDTLGILDWTGVVIADSGAGVEFDSGARPRNLPGNKFPKPTLHSFDSDRPTKPMGVDAIDEWVSFTLGFSSGSDFNSLLGALALPPGSPAFQIGLHVQGLPCGKSDSFLNEPPDTTPPSAPPTGPPIPEPATMGLLGMGVAGLLLRRRGAKI